MRCSYYKNKSQVNPIKLFDKDDEFAFYVVEAKEIFLYILSLMKNSDS
jgi:hypothetical protein